MVMQEVLRRPPARQRSSGRAVLATSCCGVFFSFASVVVYTFGVFLKPLQDAFHWSRGQLSLAFTLAALTVAACSPFLGRLLDRYPARRVVLPCTVVYGVAFASLALLTPHLWHLYAVFVLLGVVGNGTAQLGYARAVSTWFNASRGRALATVMAGSGVGSMIFPVLAEQIIVRLGWRAAYGIIGASILLIAVPLAFFFLFESEAAADDPRMESNAGASRYLWSLPFLTISLGLLLFSFATNALNTHWVALLTDKGANPREAALIVSFAGFAALCSKLGSGYLLDRFRAGRVTAMMLGASAIGFALVATPYTRPGAAAGALLIGGAMGAESDAVPYLLSRYFGLEHFGTLYGYTWLVYALAGGTGPLIMGTVFDRTGSYRVMLGVCLGMVCSAAALFAALPAYRSGSRLRPRTPELAL
jgi:MFS family permease